MPTKEEFKAAIKNIPPDIHYEEWRQVICAICECTKGVENGLKLAKRWSFQDGYDYTEEKDGGKLLDV